MNTDKLLNVRTANKCIEEAKLKPIPKMLFSEFWHENELCILFADTNLGKSILAVQIADSISKGISINRFRLQAKKQAVLYFDFELNDKQFEKRYSRDYKNHYRFDDTLFRINLNAECADFEEFESRLFSSIEEMIPVTKAKTLIVDNLTYLNAHSAETAKEALPLMKRLKELKQKHGLSILILAHTPKRYGLVPISNNDLAGSKHLSNFADSILQ